jgi:threonine aldolase
VNFRSDNVAGIAPEILAAIAAANEGSAPSYGADAITGALDERFSSVFERPVAVFPVATGTAANALALAALSPPWGAIYCHEEAHIAIDECGAPEFYAGAKLIGVPGADGKIDAAGIAARLTEKGFVHQVQPAAISISQTTEAGTLYTVDEVTALGAFAREHGMRLHMDGARFANAIAALECAPADITWRAGVDVLSFGATKNGALAAEAVIFFDAELASDFGYRRKRGGHLFSKMRFLSVQLDTYLADGLWLRNARHANAMAARLAGGLAALPGARLRHPVQGNEIFVELPAAIVDGLEQDGFGFYRWDGEAGRLLRLVTAFNSRPQDVDALIAAAQRHLTG